MFKGSENYSFEMDESCTCQVYQSCTLHVSFPLASMHNFPSMHISTRRRRARGARGARNTFPDAENGSSGLIREQNNAALLVGGWSRRSRRDTNPPRSRLLAAGRGGLGQPELPSNSSPPLTSQASAPPPASAPLRANIIISLMRMKSPAWRANKLEARFSFTHRS